MHAQGWQITHGRYCQFASAAPAARGDRIRCLMSQYPWHILLVVLSGFINRQQQDLIAYLQEENRVLREKLSGKRIILNQAVHDPRSRSALHGSIEWATTADLCRRIDGALFQTPGTANSGHV